MFWIQFCKAGHIYYFRTNACWGCPQLHFWCICASLMLKNQVCLWWNSPLMLNVSHETVWSLLWEAQLIENCLLIFWHLIFCARDVDIRARPGLNIKFSIVSNPDHLVIKITSVLEVHLLACLIGLEQLVCLEGLVCFVWIILISNRYWGKRPLAHKIREDLYLSF